MPEEVVFYCTDESILTVEDCKRRVSGKVLDPTGC